MNQHERSYLRFQLGAKTPRRHLFRGEWMTVGQIAEATGIHVSTVRERIKAGFPPDIKRRSSKEAALYEFQGEKLPIRTIAERLGICMCTVYGRVSGNRVLDDDELANRPKEARSTDCLVFMRGESRTITEWAKHYGINRYTVYSRIARGWDPIRATITPPEWSGPKRRYVFNGRALTLAEWEEVTGIDRNILRTRITDLGWPITTALTTPMHPTRARLYTFNGESLTLPQWAKRYGIHYATVQERLSRGWPVERALTEPIMPPNGRRKRRQPPPKQPDPNQATPSGKVNKTSPSQPDTVNNPLTQPPTGGYSLTSDVTQGTGGGRQPRDLQAENAVFEDFL